MKLSILCTASVLALLAIPDMASAQHYTDWTGFEFKIIGEEEHGWDAPAIRIGDLYTIYEVQKDYTISLPEYFLDGEKLPEGFEQHVHFMHDWAAYNLPVCDWDFLRLEEGGILTLKRGFRCDGPSYPYVAGGVNVQQRYHFRAAFVHDALYELMRLGYLEPDTHHRASGRDRHSWDNEGDRNRIMADMMIYMIGVEDGQPIGDDNRTDYGDAWCDWNVLRRRGAPATHDDYFLLSWKFHVSQLTAYASDGQVELNWKVADDARRDRNFDDHFSPYHGHEIIRNDILVGFVSYTTTSFIDRAFIENGTVYCYQIRPHPDNKNQYDWSNEEHIVPMNGPGNALLLDGIDDYIEANNLCNDLVGSVDYNGSITMEAWVYPEEQAIQAMILAFNTIGGGNYNLLSYSGSTHRFCYYDGDNGYLCSTDEFSTGSWYHVAVIINELGSGILMVDGEEQFAFTTTIRPSHGARFSIGQEWDDWDGMSVSQCFKGMVDEVRIWISARTQGEIQADMYHPLRGDEAGLVGLWHFDEPNDLVLWNDSVVSSVSPWTREAFDATAHANDGLLVGYKEPETDTAFVPSGAMSLPTDVDSNDPDNLLPRSHELAQNYPNPFNPATDIEFYVPTRSHVTIEILNLLGQKVSTLVDETKSAGFYRISWDGHGSDGQDVSTGVYFYRYRAGDFVETKKMLLLK